MTILSVIQNVTDELGITRPTSVISNTENDIRVLLALANDAVDKIKTRHNWVDLHKTYTFSTTDTVDTYAMPNDFDKLVSDTLYNRTTHWELNGITPQDYAFRKSGLVQTSINKEFILKGYSSKQFVLHPVPSAIETIAFEYQSTNAILPIVWTASYSFSADSYCSYNGNIYKTSSSGISGATPPTHTSGSVSDGSITWVYQDIKYNRFLKDTDFFIIDEEILEDYLKFMWLRSKGLDYRDLEREAKETLDSKFAGRRGAKTLNLLDPCKLKNPLIPETIEV